MNDFLRAHRVARQAGRRHRAGLHLDGDLHPGEPVDAARPHAHWDHAKGAVVGDAEANKLLRRPYRAPWVHPDPAKV